MNRINLQIEIYQTGGGRKPYLDWYSKLDKPVRAIIAGRLERVRHGNLGDCKSLGDGVFELRVNFGPGYRVYFGMERDKLVLLLCAGNKTTQVRDINTAKIYWKNWEA